MVESVLLMRKGILLELLPATKRYYHSIIPSAIIYRLSGKRGDQDQAVPGTTGANGTLPESDRVV